MRRLPNRVPSTYLTLRPLSPLFCSTFSRVSDPPAFSILAEIFLLTIEGWNVKLLDLVTAVIGPELTGPTSLYDEVS